MTSGMKILFLQATFLFLLGNAGPVSKYFVVEKTLYAYDGDAYEEWSSWGNCSLKNECIQTRYRVCKDKSYQESFDDYTKNQGCNTKFIIEKRKCEGAELARCTEKISEFKDKIRKKFENCGENANPQMKIVGGHKVKDNKAWPWNVGLFLDIKGISMEPFCSGTLITPQHVVTAAHCLENIVSLVNVKPNRIPKNKWVKMSAFSDEIKILAKVNDNDLTTREDLEIHQYIESIIIHPQYNNKLGVRNDLAIFRLNNSLPIEQTENVCLPRMNEELPLNSTCYAIGWGSTEKGTNNNKKRKRILETISAFLSSDRLLPSEFLDLSEEEEDISTENNSEVLMETKMPLKNIRQCSSNMRYIDRKVHICAGEVGIDTCRGDSGGGLFCQDQKLNNKWVLYGITSFGVADGCGLHSGVYTAVHNSVKWIEDILYREELDRHSDQD